MSDAEDAWEDVDNAALTGVKERTDVKETTGVKVTTGVSAA